MIFLVAPERRKWFLAQAKDIDELMDQECIQRLFRKGDGAIAIPFSKGMCPPILFPSGDHLSTKQVRAETEHLADVVSKGRLHECCLSAREASAAWVMFLGGVIHEMDEEDSE